MKVIGAVLIVASTTLWGFMKAQRYVARPNQLQQLKTALQLLQTEISYGVTPLPQAFSKLESKLESPIADFFSQARNGLQSGLTAKQAWQKAIEEVGETTALIEKDRQALEELGYNLGQSSSEDQLRYLELAQDNLDNLHKKALEKKENKVKLWRYLGVLSGLLVVVLIL